MVYVSDVVDALILAAEKEEAVGERFVIGHDISPTYREIINVVAESLDVSPPRWSVPYWLAKPAAVFLQSAGDLLGMKPYRFADYLDYTVQDGVLDISKAKRVLEFQPKVTLKEGMAKTVAWFQEHGGRTRTRESLSLAGGFSL
jgi:nucleoside-diphosphate-sugar epimerase